MRAEVVIARARAGKGEHDDAQRRLTDVLARAYDPAVLREAADALVDLHLARDERANAVAVLEQLRPRTTDLRLRWWAGERFRAITGKEPPPLPNASR